MSGRRNGAGFPGSVRRARELAESGAAPDPAQLPQCNDNSPTRQPLPAPAAFKTVEQDSKGSVISRPTPIPLSQGRNDKTPSPEGRVSPPRKGPPPQRPPRPGNVPSLLDSSKVHEYAPSVASRNLQRSPPNPQPAPNNSDNNDNDNNNNNNNNNDDDGNYGNKDNDDNVNDKSNNKPSPPSTNQSVSAPSDERLTSSSVGTIPDFPIPAGQSAEPPNNGTPLPPAPPPPPPIPPSGRKATSGFGPPPSTRRGASSYYSTNTFVTTIQEEKQEGSRDARSYASSKVMPSSWGSAPVKSEIINAYIHINDGEGDRPDCPPPVHEGDEADDVVDEEDNADDDDDDDDDHEEVGLVREASVGKRAKPSLRTISKPQSENNDDEAPKRPDPPPKDPIPQQDNNARSPTIAPSLAVPASLFSGSPKPTTSLKKEVDQHSRRRSHSSSSSSDSSSDDYDLEKPPIAKLPHPTLKELEMEDLRSHSRNGKPRKKDMNRPPQLNIGIVREAEERGSLTSLPDLVKRATRAVTNLDHGRTASNPGMLDKFNTSGDVKAPGQRRSASSLSNMLASFPHPSAVTPSSDWNRNHSRADSDGRFPRNHSDSRRRRRRRRHRRRLCCGMPRWIFALFAIGLVLIIALAIILPVVLVVLPRQNAEGAGGSSTSADSCDVTNPCQNGGVGIGSPGSCGCVCVDGFSGPNCAEQENTSCATLEVDDPSVNYANATVGSSLPRLFENSEADFGIPLGASTIVSVFNTEDVSCTSENAIVTFNGYHQRRSLPLDLPPGHHRRLRERTSELARRDPLEEPSPRSEPSISNRTLDFARVAVLFILEQTGDFGDAATANESIQRFFTTAEEEGTQFAEPMDVQCEEQAFTLDFVNFSITTGDGTVVGGAGG